jgi:hypothetical protein
MEILHLEPMVIIDTPDFDNDGEMREKQGKTGSE